MRHKTLAFSLVLVLLSAGVLPGAVILSDVFNGSDNGPLDPAKWSVSAPAGTSVTIQSNQAQIFSGAQWVVGSFASNAGADFFAPDHFAQFPNLHQLFWEAIHGAGDVKKSIDAGPAEALLAKIDEIADIFWQTEKAKTSGVYPPS